MKVTEQVLEKVGRGFRVRVPWVAAGQGECREIVSGPEFEFTAGGFWWHLETVLDGTVRRTAAADTAHAVVLYRTIEAGPRLRPGVYTLVNAGGPDTPAYTLIARDTGPTVQVERTPAGIRTYLADHPACEGIVFTRGDGERAAHYRLQE